MAFTIRPVRESDREWMRLFLEERWGAAAIVTRGLIHNADRLDGFIAGIGAEPAGLITFRHDKRECEVVTLDSVREGEGIGTALLAGAVHHARESGCARLWLITTNDNLDAVRVHQKRGLHLAAIYPNALEESRRLKPEIPLTGIDRIPLRDEIELEIVFDGERAK